MNMCCVENLESKIDSLLKAYSDNCAKIESLRNEINMLSSSLQQKDLQISALYDEIGNRDRIIESLKTSKKATLTNIKKAQLRLK